MENRPRAQVGYRNVEPLGEERLDERHVDAEGKGEIRDRDPLVVGLSREKIVRREVGRLAFPGGLDPVEACHD
jgi:hypothetical protein